MGEGEGRWVGGGRFRSAEMQHRDSLDTNVFYLDTNIFSLGVHNKLGSQPTWPARREGTAGPPHEPQRAWHVRESRWVSCDSSRHQLENRERASEQERERERERESLLGSNVHSDNAIDITTNMPRPNRSLSGFKKPTPISQKLTASGRF